MAEPEGAERPEPTRSDDELFAELVAGFDEPVAEDARSWPEAEDVADLSDFAPQARPRPVIRPLPVVQAVPPVDPRAWSPAEDPDEDHYVPPPPPPITAEPATKLALLALVGGVVLALLGGFAVLPSMATFLGVMCAAGGVVTLVARMRDPDEDDQDDDPNHGAVV
ncbi:hypothetical protein [Streptacidiphilus rugosus]|uniref:hypothetical protein n=1 Tax=Streptacidiphilus rugosus TaxID=405783 RepID=UPI00068D7D16|nr:hypothetical protein [Streptacidiphilus rugosus]